MTQRFRIAYRNWPTGGCMYHIEELNDVIENWQPVPGTETLKIEVVQERFRQVLEEPDLGVLEVRQVENRR